MTENTFEKIGNISTSGSELIESTIKCFCPEISDFQKDHLRESIITLVRSERLDAVVEGLEYWKNNVI